MDILVVFSWFSQQGKCFVSQICDTKASGQWKNNQNHPKTNPNVRSLIYVFYYLYNSLLTNFGELNRSTVTEFAGRSHALFRVTTRKTTLPRLFWDFFSNDFQIKKVLLGMSPKIAIFRPKCEARTSSKWCNLRKNDTRHLAAAWCSVPPRFLP